MLQLGDNMIDKVIAETIKEAKNQLYQDVRKGKNIGMKIDLKQNDTG